MKYQYKVTLYSQLLMGLTTVHHIYGAIVYNTPWRLHVLFISIPVIVITALIDWYLKRKDSTHAVFLWCYDILILTGSVLLIGLFEGVYNHVVKNILFLSGLSNTVMNRIFMAYTAPDDFFFELTGVLQGVVALVLIFYFYRLVVHQISAIGHRAKSR